MRRLAILLAAVGALLVAPAAHAETGVEPVKVVLGGSGAGRAYIDSTTYRGDPAKEIKCAYKAPGPQTGVCETLMSNEGAGWEQLYVHFEASVGSKLLSVTPIHVETEACGLFPGSTMTGICTPYVEPPGTGSGDAEVIATFDKEKEPAGFRVVRLGEGTVVSSPAGIFCGTTCEAEFEGQAVTLTASPAADWALGSWTGCDSRVGLKCMVTAGSLRTVMVTFIPTSLLTVEKAGTGYGRVVTTGISCDESCSRSTSAIKQGTPVTVKASPAKGYEFAGFEGGSGNASSCSATCTFTISEKSSVKAKFSPIPTKALTVELTGPAAYRGKVTGKGVTVKGLYSIAINCGLGCMTETESFFATGETELIATTTGYSTGFSFQGWTVEGGTAGTCTGTTTPCKLLTDANKTVKAKFE